MPEEAPKDASKKADGTGKEISTDKESTKDKSVNVPEEERMLDEPDDELEEFDEIGGNDKPGAPEVAHWDEHWDATGWDDEDVNDDFIRQLQNELESFKKAQPALKQAQKA